MMVLILFGLNWVWWGSILICIYEFLRPLTPYASSLIWGGSFIVLWCVVMCLQSDAGKGRLLWQSVLLRGRSGLPERWESRGRDVRRLLPGHPHIVRRPAAGSVRRLRLTRCVCVCSVVNYYWNVSSPLSPEAQQAQSLVVWQVLPDGSWANALTWANYLTYMENAEDGPYYMNARRILPSSGSGHCSDSLSHLLRCPASYLSSAAEPARTRPVSRYCIMSSIFAHFPAG